MKWITYILLSIAALLLILPALLIGSYLYVLAVIVVVGAAILVLRDWPTSKWSDIALAATSAIAVLALFLGIHPLFPVISLMLSVYAWNAGHRFGHLEHAQVDDEAKRQLVIQILIFSLIPPLVMGLFLTAFLYVRFSLPFGLGLGLSSAALLSVAAFMGFARAARNRED
jgi:hypothetical protein